MAPTAIPASPKRGRPRSGRTEKAILKAASDLVASTGLADMTIEGVAERAGVGKASIYRRWPSKGALVFDAVLDSYLATQPTAQTGTLEGDLLSTARSWIRSATSPQGGRIWRRRRLTHLHSWPRGRPASRYGAVGPDQGHAADACRAPVKPAFPGPLELLPPERPRPRAAQRSHRTGRVRLESCERSRRGGDGGSSSS